MASILEPFLPRMREWEAVPFHLRPFTFLEDCKGEVSTFLQTKATFAKGWKAEKNKREMLITIEAQTTFDGLMIYLGNSILAIYHQRTIKGPQRF